MSIKDINEDKKWKQDFPYHKQDARLVGRREFAKMLTLVSGGFALGSGLIAAKNEFDEKEQIKGAHFVCEVDEVPKGGTRSFVLKGSSIPYILIHLEDGTFRAYEQKCTHLSCSVYYEPGSGQIVCPCHHGFFDAKTGEVISGPPPRALPHLEVMQKENQLFVTAPKSS